MPKPTEQEYLALGRAAGFGKGTKTVQAVKLGVESSWLAVCPKQTLFFCF